MWPLRLAASMITLYLPSSRPSTSISTSPVSGWITTSPPARSRRSSSRRSTAEVASGSGPLPGAPSM